MAMQHSEPSSTGAAGEYTLSNGERITLLPHETFYAELITRNRGLITPDEQRALRTAHFLIAGCGSVGGAVIEPLVRMGAERLTLAEPGEYDLPNLNRQSARLQDIGKNKALVFRERMGDINPFATLDVDERGIVEENVAGLVGGATLIMDGVDVTTKPPLRSKFLLHREARRRNIPIVAGYDIAGLQMLLIYDYRHPATQILHGKVREEEIDDLEPFEFLARVIPKVAIPSEIIPVLRRQIRGEAEGFPQIVYTAQLYGVLALRAALDLLADRPIRRRIMVDVNDLMRPPAARVRTQLARLVALYRLNAEFQRNRKRAATRANGQPRRA